MQKLILASSSPRRKSLLEQIGLEFEIDPSHYQEDMTLSVEPKTLARILARGKAFDVAQRYNSGLIIGADTFLAFEDSVIGKPKNTREAKQMLKRLAGQTHSVISGVAVIDAATKHEEVRAIETLVTFRDLSQEEIDDYVASGEPLDKAGAYGIQGRGAVLIKKIDGDYFNVVGLPLATLMEILHLFQ
ncbi:septum formation inhibitor Maf [Patescibacteria group bacterium]|nr:septum formation inhibitor Maf [Patescibacteria group bacterium]